MKDQDAITTKPGLAEEWSDAVDKNKDSYGYGVVQATVPVCKALDDGLSCEEAEKACYGLGITDFMAGCMAQWIIYFHPRGEEFKKYWNKHCGGTGDEDGVINPAIITPKTKED